MARYSISDSLTYLLCALFVNDLSTSLLGQGAVGSYVFQWYINKLINLAIPKGGLWLLLFIILGEYANYLYAN